MFPFAPRHGFDLHPEFRGTGTLHAPRAVEELDPDAPERDELPAPFWLRVVTGRRLRATRTDGLAPSGVTQMDLDPRRRTVML